MTDLAPAKKRVPYFSTEATVDVEIDPDDLHADGWHHESECKMTGPNEPVPLVLGGTGYQDAIASLHRQAHPSQSPDPAACSEEPCRSIDIIHLIARLGRPA